MPMLPYGEPNGCKAVSDAKEVECWLGDGLMKHYGAGAMLRE